ncbi:MAG: type IX secretion system membrane protein PorP/SprF [Sediminibacterium sp.]
MKRFLRYLLILLIAMSMEKTCYAQEDATNTQYLFNLLNLNPAYAGARGAPTLTTSFRKQWIGVPGAPATAIFSIDAPLNEHHLGVGLQLYNNTLGIERTTGVNASFSTMLNFDEGDNEHFLALGLQVGLMNYRIDRTSVPLPFQNDPSFLNNTNVIMPTAGLGIYYQRPRFYVSFSAPSLLISTVKVDKLISVNSPTLKNMQLIFTTGLTAQLGDDFQVRPSFFLKWMSGKVFDIHVNSSVWVKELVGVGFSYRFDDAVAGILELRISNRLGFGYSYSRSIGEKVVFNQGTHEAMLRLNLAANND